MSTYGVSGGADPIASTGIQSLSASPSSNVAEGTTVTVSLTLKNNGSGSGILWGRLKNGAGNIIGSSKDTGSLSTDSTATLSWDVTMPGHDLTIEAEAGHYEEEEEEAVCCEIYNMSTGNYHYRKVTDASYCTTNLGGVVVDMSNCEEGGGEDEEDEEGDGEGGGVCCRFAGAYMKVDSEDACTTVGGTVVGMANCE